MGPQDGHEAESRARAEAGFDRLVAKYGAKYDKAAACLAKDRGAARLLRISCRALETRAHPIESTFATVRLKTDKTKGCLSRVTALAMVFKLAKSAERHWRRLDGASRLGQVSRASRSATAKPFKTTRSKPPAEPVHQDRA